MLPATTCVKPPIAISQVINVMTGSLAVSAAGSIQTIAAMMNPEDTPRRHIVHHGSAPISRAISSIETYSVSGMTGKNVQNSAANSVPARLATSTIAHRRLMRQTL